MTRHRTAAGLSLVEVLVAMALGLALLLAMASLHARVLHMSADSTRTADAQDTLRIALAILEFELSHAGHWGLVPEATRIAGRRTDAAPLAVTVSGDCGADWTIDLERVVEAWSGGWPLACAPYAGAAPIGALLVLRRTAGRSADPETGALQVHADPWGGRLVVTGEPALPGEEIQDLVARAYYVSPHSTGDASRPSLRRKTLQRGPRIVDEEVVPGIAGLEIAFGIDTDPPGAPGHGMPNRFVAPELAAAPVVAVRVGLVTDDDTRLALRRTIPLRNGPAP